VCPSRESLNPVAYTTRRVMVLELPRWSLGVVPLKVRKCGSDSAQVQKLDITMMSLLSCIEMSHVSGE